MLMNVTRHCENTHMKFSFTLSGFRLSFWFWLECYCHHRHAHFLSVPFIRKSHSLDLHCTYIWVNSKCSCSPFFYLFKLDLLLYFSSLSIWPCSMACKVLVPWPGIKSKPWLWKHWVLTTGPPGNSLFYILNRIQYKYLWCYMYMDIYVCTKLYI